MKRTILTLSFVCLGSCAAAPFPREMLYVADITNRVCAEYEIVDLSEIKFRLVRELELLPKGPCDRMAGFMVRGFKKVQNWIRDRIKDEK
jgi:hypothetical protein